MSTPGTINVEYAKSSRASCRKCKATIGAGSLRVGPMVQSYMGDFLVPMWHHFKCFKVSKYITSYKGIDQLAGMDALKADDQIKLRELVEGGSINTVPATTKGKKKPVPKKKRRRGSSSSDSSSSDSSSSSSSDEEDTKQPKARQGAKSEADAELIRQSDEVWKWRKRISDHLGNTTIRYILDVNQQPTTGTRFGGIDAIQTRLAEAFVYGVLPKCSVCKGGDLVYTSTPQDGSRYVCTGYLDEYALCGASHPLHTIKTTPVLQASPSSNSSSAAASSKGALVREGSKYKASNGELEAIFKEYSPHKPTPARVSLNSTTSRTNSVVVKDSTEVVVPSSALAEVADPTSTTPTISKTAALLAHCQARNSTDGAKGVLEGQVVIFAGRQLQDTQKVLGAQVKKLGGTTTTNPSEATMCICGEDVVLDAKKQGSSSTTKPSQIIYAYSVPCLREVFLSAASKGGAIPTTQAALEEFLHTDCPSNLFTTTTPLQLQPSTTIPVSNKSGLGAAAVPLRSFAAVHVGSRISGGPRVVKVQASGAIDPDSGLDGGSATIYSPTGSERDGYNATLSVVNIQTGQNGFYILQLIQHGKKFTVFRRWGRVGSDRIGGSKATVYHSIHPAKTEFCAVFLDKSGNDWDHLTAKAKEAGPPATRSTFFVKRAGMGVLVETDYSSSASPFDNLDESNSTYKGQLSKPTQELMRLIFDIKAMQTALKELHIDTDKMPLGKLSRSSIANGYSALSEIEAILSTPEPQGEGGDTSVASHHRHTKIISLSNKFFSFVPHVMENEASPILNTVEIVAAKTTLLNELLDLCAAYETAMKPASTPTHQQSSSSSASSPATIHPVDESYNKLNTDLSEVPHSSVEFKRIAAYVKDTHGPTHTAYRLELQDLWSVERVDEAKRFEPHASNHNRQLLWHGSRVTNWGGILSQGLRIAPPEAPVTGYMFGKGVYFADVVSKSANYCSTSREHNTGLMALCEVALGDMSQLKRAKYVTKLPTGCQSTMGVGRYHPTPQGTWTMGNGCQVPAGKTCKAPDGKDSDLLYNEYIVYDVSQIRTKYLLKLKFVYL